MRLRGRFLRVFTFYSLIVLIFSCLYSFAETLPSLTLADFPAEIPAENHPLWSLQGQMVRVRGFWYPISNEEGVIAAYPNLKSCCLGASPKIYQQLIVKNYAEFFSPDYVINFEGIFRIDPQYNLEGKLKQIYILEKAKAIHQASSYSVLIIAIGSISAVLLGWKIYLHLKKVINKTDFK